MEFLALQLRNCSLCLHSHMAFSLCVSVFTWPSFLCVSFLSYKDTSDTGLRAHPTLVWTQLNYICNSPVSKWGHVPKCRGSGLPHSNHNSDHAVGILLCKFFLLNIKFEIDPYVVGITNLFLFVFKYLSTGWLSYTSLAVL